MEFIANLKRSIRRVSGPAKAPDNLLELGDRMRESAGPEVANYCRLWAGELRRLRTTEGQRLNSTRGSSRRLWAEQSLIYQDLFLCLEQAASQLDGQSGPLQGEILDEFDSLIAEFGESLAALAAWSRSQHPRCLACGWDGSAPGCPHCRLQTLKPIRQAQPVYASVTLAEAQEQVFGSIVAILEGACDLESLWHPLQHLHQQYDQAAAQVAAALEVHPEVEAVVEYMDQALEGLAEISQVFEDFDAQHLEDGWHRFFTSEISLTDALQQADDEAEDRVNLSREE